MSVRRRLAAIGRGAITLVLVACIARMASAQGVPAATQGPERFEKNVAVYEAADRATAPPKGAILIRARLMRPVLGAPDRAP